MSPSDYKKSAILHVTKACGGVQEVTHTHTHTHTHMSIADWWIIRGTGRRRVASHTSPLTYIGTSPISPQQKYDDTCSSVTFDNERAAICCAYCPRKSWIVAPNFSSHLCSEKRLRVFGKYFRYPSKNYLSASPPVTLQFSLYTPRRHIGRAEM